MAKLVALDLSWSGGLTISDVIVARADAVVQVDNGPWITKPKFAALNFFSARNVGLFCNFSFSRNAAENLWSPPYLYRSRFAKAVAREEPQAHIQSSTGGEDKI